MAAVVEAKHLSALEVEVRLAARLLRTAVAGLDPADVLVRDVVSVWSAFDQVERLAANAKVLLAARVEAAGVWKRAGAKSAAAHLARLSGSGVGQARRVLENSRQLAALPVVADAVRSGVLSGAQVEAIVPAAAADPDAATSLISVAGSTNVHELREACLRVSAAADPDRDATDRRIHAERRAATRVDGEGGWNLVARGTVAAGARLELALEPIIDRLYEQARVAGRNEPREVYAFDALIALADGAGEVKPSRKVRYFGIVQASVEALTRGAVIGEERCEIAGVGPVPVRVARELLGESILKLVITRGVDVMNVTHLGRGPTAAQRVAVLWTKPKCANAACSSRFVELDHREPWVETKHTRLDELDPLCPHDHDLKTHHGWSLVDGTGRRAFVAPDDPRHPRNRPPP